MENVRMVTWRLEMLEPAAERPRPLRSGTRIDLATSMTPEFARFLFGLVGGPWFWIDRLSWTRQQWVDELAVPGTEFWVLYGEGVPLGYVHLQPRTVEGKSHVQIRYFGLAEQAIGRGLGKLLLEHGIHSAWSLSERCDIPSVSRIWVTTCSLDGPAALSNYKARGLVVYETKESDVSVPKEPLGAWVSTGGKPNNAP